MKNRLLLLAAMLLTSVASFGEWVLPRPTQQALDLEGGGQYFYNVEYAGFLCGSNDWSTRASVERNKGIEIKITEGASEGAYKMGAFSPDGLESVWIDGSRDGNDQWTFAVLADGTFTIGNLKFPDTYLTWTGDESNTRTNFTESAVNGTWYATSEAEFNRMTAAGMVDQIKLIAAAIDLGKKIAKAETDCPGIDLADEKAVYAKDGSAGEKATLTEINDAIKSVAEKVALYEATHLPWDQATPLNPLDVTLLIKNAHLDAADGWNGSPVIGGNAVDKCAEKYNTTFDVNQIINNLHPGVYNLKAQGFYRHGSTNGASEVEDDYDAICPAKFYGGIVETNVPSIFRDNSLCDPAWGGAYVASDPDRGQAPNNMDAASFAFSHGLYSTSVIVPLGVDTMQIGVKKATNIDMSWAIFNNFQLEYLGDIEDSWALVDTENLLIAEDVVMQKSLKETYNNLVKNLKTGKSATWNEISEMKAAIDANIAAYVAYQAAIDNAKIILVDLTRTGQYYARLNRYLNTERAPGYVDPAQTEDKEYNTFKNGSAVTILQNLALSTEEMEAETEFLNKMAASSANHDLHPGQDMTYRIVNPKFSDAAGTGWTFDKISVGNAYLTGGYADFPCAEAWSGSNLKFKVSQVVKDMPAGLYSISCNAFVRMGGNQSATIDDNGDAYLYMGDFENQIGTIFTEGITEEDWNAGKKDEIVCGKALSTNDQPWTLHTELGKYFPDGMRSASQAFAMGMYKTTAYGLVEETGDVEIGFAKLVDNTANNQWVLWTNFQLIYEGDNPDATSSVIYKLIDDNKALNNKIAEKGIKMPSDWGSDETDLLAKVSGDLADYEAAPGAVSDELKAALFDDVNQITKMMKEKRARVAVLEKFADELQALDDSLGMLYEKWDMYDPDGMLGIWDALDEWDDLRIAHKQKLAAGAASSHMDEFRAKSAEFQVITRTPELDEEAVSDEPQDLTGYLANPTMDNPDFFNWNGTAFANQLGNGVTGGEIFNAKYNVWHDLYLNPGFYQFKVYGFDRRGSWAEEDVDDEKNYAFVYVAKVVGGDTTLVAQLPMRTGYSLWSEEALADEDGCIHADETYTQHEGMWAPNNMNTAMQWHQALKDEEIDKPMSTAIDFEVQAGAEDVHYILGVKKDELKGTNSWTIIEEVQLVYAADQKVDAIQDIEPVQVAPGVLVDGKYLENGKVVIIKNGVKYMLNGARK